MKVIPVLLTLYLFVTMAQVKYGGGSGEPNDPYLIYTAEQMNEIGLYENDWDKHFKLMSDIDLSAYNGTSYHLIGRFTPGSGPPVGRGGGQGDPDEWKPFTGVFDGNDHVISNFTHDCNGISIVALFRCVAGRFAEIRDLGLIDPIVHAEAGNHVGLLVGRLMEGGAVVGCYVEGGRIEGSWSAGGLVGTNDQGMIKACHSTASVSGNLSVGGIVGYNLEGTITHCYSLGNVGGDKQIGGLIGSNGGGKMNVCYFSGFASGSYEVGGLVGENEDGTISQCYSSGNVWGSEYVGGLVGSNYGWVGTSAASPDAILNCYSSSSVSGDDMVGGLVGATMISCPQIGYPPGIPAFYESGPVTIQKCYATGSVVGGRTVGGLVGEGGTVCDCFWDTQTSGQTISARGEGKTTTEMQTASTFFGWGGCGEEPIWTIDEGNDYPRLYWENKPGELLTVLPLSGLLLGSGIPDKPYLVHTPEELNLVAAALCDWDKCFRLMADIDLSSFSYEAALIAPDRDRVSLGFQGTPFSGVFDGNGHTISHLTIDGVSHIGLFGQLGSGAKITNLGLEVVDVNGSGDYVGGLVGQNFYDGSINTCYSAGTVSGESFWIGGLVGYNNGSITTCYSTGKVCGERSYIGGLVGVNNGSIATSYSAGSVTGNSDVGGLVGYNRDSITTSYSTTAVTGDSSVGGLVGYNSGTVAMSYGIGPVTGNEEVGGLIGDDEGKILTRPGNTTSSFWDIETSSQTESAGGEGKTTTEMQTTSTFLDAGWDFMFEANNDTNDIWWIDEGQDYPRLWWQYGRAFSPYPQDGVVDVPQPLTFSWFPGGSGLYHNVYFGEDEEAVINATTESPDIYRGRQEPEITTYNPGNLGLDKIYYWRIDEVSDTDPNNLGKGDVWSFTTANFIIVDDFEDYNSYPSENRIWRSWKDGLGYGQPDTTPDSPSNGTGSVVGDDSTPSYTEEIIVHGGCQSMPFSYENNKYWFARYSESEKILNYPRDWTEGGVTELSLWFHGRQASVGSFVEGPAGIYTMTSSGKDIGWQDDQFHYAFKTLTGPGTIVAKIESMENTHELAKAGVMIRNWLSSYSQYTLVCVTPSNGVVFQGRGDPGPETSFTINQTEITAPHWVKLERDTVGDFTASHSVNGINWQPVQNANTMDISMSSNVYIGLALTAHNTDATCRAVFSNVTITGTVSTQWAHQDIGIASNDAEPMYVAVLNSAGQTAVVVHPDAASTQITTWTEWMIPLQMFADQGVDLTDVDRIAIGFGTRGNMTIPGGQGKMYFDDIRLYRPRSTASNDLEVNIP